MGMAITIPRYTVDQLDQFFDDGNRYELLDGILIVTPAPSARHQVVVSRIQGVLIAALQSTGDAHVVSPGAVCRRPGNQLEPDILVYPARFPPDTDWEAISEHWLAVEVLSRSSRFYDREVKRAAYLALGVGAVWLVDIDARAIEVFDTGSRERVTGILRWQLPALDRVVEIDLGPLFAGFD